MIKTRLFAFAATFAAVLASPAAAFALNVNEEYQPQDEFELVPWIPIEIFGIDMSINKAVMYVVIAAVLSCVTLIYVGHRMQMKPGRIQAAVEMYYGLIESITKGNLSGAMVNRWFPFLATIFLFIWALAAKPVTGFMLFTFGVFAFLLVLILLYVYKARLLEGVTEPR